ncbi:MAG TPA: serine/threonine-protein kinase [Kofleriaceae bacterium]|nr:serine/threonine-protein kinase [Kofleriaceae bacterium]
MPACPSCNADVLDIDVKCKACGAHLGSTGAQRLIGTTVLAQYEIIEVLGQGGMSVVFRARHTMTDQEVALKVLPPDLAAYSQVKSRFLEEAKALAALDHPNIVHLYNFGQENGSFVLAMQYVRGNTWERMILESGKQPWPTALRICIDVLRALEYAHGRGVVHRDMKPSNVLVREDDGTATVMDFGIAKMTTSTRLTATGQTMGTVRYMSPEQVRGQEVDLRSDIYSLGATLYEALTGDTPFDGNTHFEIMSKHLSEPAPRPSATGIEIPAALEAALLRSLAKKADDRFDNARDFRKELEGVLKEGDVGHAETLRMSRDAMADARSRIAAVAANAPVATPASASSSDAATRNLRENNPTGLADRLEPGDTGAERSTSGTGRSRTGLWLGLGVVVLLAGAGVGFLVLRGNGAGASGPTDAPVTAAPKEFQPAGVTWKASSDFRSDGITVRVADPLDWTPADVAASYRRVMNALPKVLEKKAPAATKFPEHFTVQVVPKEVLCDPRILDGADTVDCKTFSTYYRVTDRTLLVVADRAQLRPNLAASVAEIVCIYNELPGCFGAELVEAVNVGPPD